MSPRAIRTRNDDSVVAPAPQETGSSGDGQNAGTVGRARQRTGGSPVALDRVIHERVRLAIVSALAVNDTLSFNELKALVDTSDGNLSVHARRMEEAGYITCDKSFEGRIPRTAYRLTPAGRDALQRYLDHMTALIRHVREPAGKFFSGDAL